jgi:PAS domain S-box-containing protein
MYSAPDVVLQGRLQRWSKLMVTAVMGIALLVFAGWLLHIPVLRRPFPGLVSMNPVTSVCFVLLGLAYFLFNSSSPSRNRSIIPVILSSLVFTIAIIKFLDLLFAWNIGIDRILFTEALDHDLIGNASNRMAPNTAACFFVTSIALVSLNRFEHRSKTLPSQVLTLAVALIGWLSILGYIYHERTFYGILVYIPMAVHTAMCFFLFSIALLFIQPERGIMKAFTSRYSGSVMARLLIPTVFIVPSILGYLRMEGFRSGIYSNEFGVAILIIFIIIIFAAIVWYNASLLNRRDMQKAQAEQALHDTEVQITAIFENAPDVVVVIDKAGRITKWNPQAEKLFGWNKAEVINTLLSETIIPPQFRESHQKGLRRYIETGESSILGKTIELFAVKKDNTEIDVSLSISPMTIGEEQFFIGFIRDITEKKFLENKLKTFNESLSEQVKEQTREINEARVLADKLIDSLPGVFYFYDANGKFIRWNKTFEEVTGYTSEEIAVMHPTQFFADDEKEYITERIMGVFEQGVNDAEANFLTKKGEKIPYYFRAVLIQYKGGPCLLGTGIDIAKRKAAEQQLTFSEYRFRSIIEQFPYPVVIYNKEGEYVQTNEAWEIMWEDKRENVKGYNIRKDPQMIASGLSVYVEAAYAGEVAISEPYEYDPAMIGQKGKKRWMVMTLYPLKGENEEISEVVLVLHDVTDRKIAEDQLRMSADKYKLLFANNPLPMWMLNLPEYHFTDVNHATLAQYGYSREEFLALSILDLRPQEEAARFNSALNTNIRGVHYAGIWKHKKKNGTSMYVDIVTHDFINDGKATRLVLANDVTEKYIADEKLKESFSAIRELTEHLQNIREQERAHMAREIHDELGQLLTVLKMDVSWLKKRVTTTEPAIKEKFTELLEMLDTTVKTVRRIASELRPTLLDDLGLVAAMEWHLEEFEKRSGIAKEFNTSVTEVSIDDSMKIGLFRILQESLTNVARHSQAQKVNVGLEKNNGHIILKITDNGKGFDTSRTTRKTLGLLGMKERTEMMGGEYQITSKPGEGTVVEIKVPVPVAD